MSSESRTNNRNETKAELIRRAQAYLQKNGYNAFSFQHLADDLDVKKASIHYYFRSKEDLLVALIEDYKAQFADWMKDVEGLPVEERFRKYVKIYKSFTKDSYKICPIGALSLDFHSLKKETKKAANDLIDMHRVWIQKLIEDGLAQKKFKPALSVPQTILVIGASLQGALQLARTRERVSLIEDLEESLLRILKGR